MVLRTYTIIFYESVESYLLKNPKLNGGRNMAVVEFKRTLVRTNGFF